MTQPSLSYLICSTPRSGSTLLCEALTNTGVAGRPEEYYQHRRKTGMPRRPLEYFEEVDTPEIDAHPGRLHARRRRGEPVRPAPLRHLPRVHRLDDRAGHHAQRRVRREGHVGLLQRLRRQPPRHEQQRGAVDPAGVRADLPQPVTVGLRHPPGQGRQAVSLWKAIQNWTWKRDEGDGALSATTCATTSPRSTTW